MSLGAGLLHDDEEVLWTGKPARQAPVDWIDVVACLFVLYSLGFAVVWQMLAMDAPTAFRFTGLVVSLLVCVPVVLFVFRKRSIAVSYVLTNQRLLTQTHRGIDAVPLGFLPPPVVIQQRGDGVGTISFGPPSKVSQAVAVAFRGPGATHRRMHLVQVPDAQHVASVVQAAQRG